MNKKRGGLHDAQFFFLPRKIKYGHTRIRTVGYFFFFKPMNKSNRLNKQDLTPLPVKICCKGNIFQSLLKCYYSIIKPKPLMTGTFMEFGRFVWIHDQLSITELFQSGSFGKGDLSRSEPTWLNRNIQQNKESLEEITVERRRRRRNQKVTNNENILKSDQVLDLTLHKDFETFQLDLYEAFFLVYALNSLLIKNVHQVNKMDPFFWI